LISRSNQFKANNYFEASTECIINKLDYYHYNKGICVKSIKKALKTLKDNGLIDVKNESKMDDEFINYKGKIRFIKINIVDGVKVKKLRVMAFNKNICIESIRMYLYLKSKLQDCSEIYISNKSIAEKLKIRSDRIKTYLEILSRYFLLSYSGIDNDGNRRIVIGL
jgi:hypothetical protein